MTTAYPTPDEYIQFSTGEVVPAAYFDMVQEVLGTLGRFDLTLVNATTVRASGGNGMGEKAGVGIGGALRYVTANVDQSMPGGAVGGRYTIYATTGPTLISGEADTTDYTWNLAIIKQGEPAPSTTYHRAIGYLDWSGSAITRLVQTASRRDDAPVAASSGLVAPLEAVMPSTATAPNAIVATVGGAQVFTVSRTGSITASGSFQAASVAVTQNSRTAITMTGVNAGLTIAGDTQLYRAAANALATPGSIAAGGFVQASKQAYVGARINFGEEGLPGGTTDTVLERLAANLLSSPGALALGLNLMLSSNTGSLVLGAAQDTNLSRAAAGVLQSTGSLVLGAGLAFGPGLFGAYGVTPIAQPSGWASSPTTSRRTLSYAASNDQVIDYLLTLTADLRALGWLHV